jgi:hypothetical protein
MFPSLIFRRAYDAIQAGCAGTKGDLEYLRILHLAASTMQSDVETALTALITDGVAPTSERIKALIGGETRAAVPDLVPPEIDLAVYDALLTEVAA